MVLVPPGVQSTNKKTCKSIVYRFFYDVPSMANNLGSPFGRSLDFEFVDSNEFRIRDFDQLSKNRLKFNAFDISSYHL